MDKTNAQRQKKYRTKVAADNKLAGKVLKHIYVHPADWPRIKRYLERQATA